MSTNDKNLLLIAVTLLILSLASGCSGVRGYTGKDGASCTVEQLANGAAITCEDGSTSLILNGAQGAIGMSGPIGPQGNPGVSPPAGNYDVVGLVDPCGDGPGADEVLLRLRDGRLLAHYSSGSYEFLALIGTGLWRTTDQQSCYFNVGLAPNYNVTY